MMVLSTDKGLATDRGHGQNLVARWPYYSIALIVWHTYNHNPAPLGLFDEEYAAPTRGWVFDALQLVAASQHGLTEHEV